MQEKIIIHKLKPVIMEEQKFEKYTEAVNHLLALEEIAKGQEIEVKRMLNRPNYFGDNEKFMLEMLTSSIMVLTGALAEFGAMLGRFKTMEYIKEFQ